MSAISRAVSIAIAAHEALVRDDSWAGLRFGRQRQGHRSALCRSMTTAETKARWALPPRFRRLPAMADPWTKRRLGLMTVLTVCWLALSASPQGFGLNHRDWRCLVRHHAGAHGAHDGAGGACGRPPWPVGREPSFDLPRRQLPARHRIPCHRHYRSRQQRRVQAVAVKDCYAVGGHADASPWPCWPSCCPNQLAAVAAAPLPRRRRLRLRHTAFAATFAATFALLMLGAVATVAIPASRGGGPSACGSATALLRVLRVLQRACAGSGSWHRAV